jgi:hypothetical protein
MDDRMFEIYSKKTKIVSDIDDLDDLLRRYRRSHFE